MGIAAQTTSDASALQRQAAPSGLFSQIRIATATAVLIIGIVVWLACLVLGISWYSRPFIGAFFYENGAAYGARPLGGELWAGLKAGIRPDDVLRRIGDVDFTNAANNSGKLLYETMSKYDFGAVVQVEISRPAGRLRSDDVGCVTQADGNALCTFEVQLTRFPFLDFLGYYGIGIGIGALCLGLAVWLYFKRRAQTISRLVLSVAVMAAIILSGRFEITTTYNFSTLLAAALSVASGLAIEIGVYFPYPLTVVRRYPQVRFALFFLPIVMFLGYLLLNGLSPNPNTALFTVLIFFLAGGVFLAAQMISKRQRSTSSLAREQASIVLISILIPILPLPIWLITNLIEVITGTPGISFSTVFLQPPILVFPFGITYALLVQRPVDTDRFLSEGLILGALGLMLVLGYTLITGAAYIVTAGVLRPDNPFAIGATLFVVAALFMPLRLRLERFVEQSFFKQRRQYDRRLEQVSRTLTTTIREREVVDLIYREITEALRPQFLFVYLRNPVTTELEASPEPGSDRAPTNIRFRTDGGLIRFLNAGETVLDLERENISPAEMGPDRPRLAVLNTKVLARLRSVGRINGFITVGPRPEEDDYTHEELRFLEALANQAAAALERAQVLVEAQRNERELQVLVQVSQSLNITMDFDTLLEFIYTQVDKIVSAPNFYIALRDTKTEELRYVFYQEYGERMPEREGTRWAMGRDLMSEVVRSKQPLRTDNFVRDMQRRDSANRVENNNLRAWLGVPLNAAETQTLGCIAIASTDPLITYTEDQARILWSLADLAATAIYKARLYAETNALAERMKSLNEISSGLGTLFEDIDALLQRITESAVKLLDSQAGSLLLVDESTNEMIFRHVYGGSGEDLLGRRIPAGSGIAGTVVMTGRHLVVQRASDDPRWFGEIGHQSAEFSTDSILAVPLSARGKVIGVLEVINKQDRGDFSDEDVNLLNTFASQAAIAIENANLFRMTDEALAQRVNQLFNMQRIDQELNRSLDLQRVVELTVDNAIRESDADGGALLLVSEDHSNFVVVGSAGYPESVLKIGDIFDIQHGILGVTYREGRLVLAHAAEDKHLTYPAILPGALNQLCVPLIAGETITGVLLLESTISHVFNEMTAEHIQALAEHANTAITNAQLFAQLEDANAMRTKLMSFVAHELNNPMTSIKGFSEFLLGGKFGVLNDRQVEFLGTIRRNAVRVQQIIQDLRDYTAQESGKLALKFGAVSFFEVVLDAVRSQQRAFDEKEQKLVLNVPEDMPRVWGDSNRLIQVMINLVSNANKYTPKGGAITISAEVAQNIWDEVSTNDVVHCAVTDTGIGMSAEDLAKLFTPYWRSENPEARKQEGTGLGMSLTRGLVESHGGKVWVESVVGTGTTFHITVPLATEAQAAGA